MGSPGRPWKRGNQEARFWSRSPKKNPRTTGKQRIEEYGGWFPFHMVCILSISFSLSLCIYDMYISMFVCRHFFLQICSYDVGAARQMIGDVPKLVKINFQCFARIPFCFLEDLKCSCWNNRILSHLSKKHQSTTNQPSINHQSTTNQPSINHQKSPFFPSSSSFLVAHQAPVPDVFARRWMLVPWMPAAWANSGDMT